MIEWLQCSYRSICFAISALKAGDLRRYQGVIVGESRWMLSAILRPSIFPVRRRVGWAQPSRSVACRVGRIS